MNINEHRRQARNDEIKQKTQFGKTSINLLPRFHALPLGWIGAILLAFITGMGLHIHCQNLIAEKQHSISALNQSIHTMDRESIGKHLQKPKFFLKKQRPIQLCQFLQKLTTTIPIGLYLTELSSAKGGLKAIGYAQDIPSIALWTSRLTTIHFNASLQSILRDEKNINFPMKFYVWIKL
jgi:hypothetical protein